MRITGKVSVLVFIILGIIFVLTSCITRNRVNQAPSSVTNIFPTQSERVDENYFYGKWTRSTDPEGGAIKYRVNYADSIDGLDDPQFYETIETWFLFPNLKEGIWYWRVTAIDPAGNTTKSPIWTFTVNGEELPQPVDRSEIPPNPAVFVTQVQNTSFSLSWPAYEDRQNPGNQISYQIRLYDYENQAASASGGRTEQLLLRISPATTVQTTDTSFTFQNLNSDTLYDWIIIALKNASQTSVVGSSEIRTGNNPPEGIRLLSPEDSATDVATDIALSWTAATDPDDDEIRYYVFLDTVSDTNRIVSSVEGITASQYSPESLEYGRTYYWFVVAVDTGGGATMTESRRFTTQAEGMAIPVNPVPADGNNGVDAANPPQLAWEHEKNGKGVEYSVYLSDNPKKMGLMASGLTDKNYQLQGFLEGETRYYWQVKAEEVLSGKTTLSESWTFETLRISPPVQQSAITNAEGTQIALKYDKAMKDPTGKKDNYTVKREINTLTSGKIFGRSMERIAISRIEIKPGTTDTYLLTLEEVLAHGEGVTIDYTPGTVQAMDGGKLEAYSDVPVNNMVPGEAPLVQTATATKDRVIVRFDKDMSEAPVGARNQFSVQSGAALKQIEGVTKTASDTYTLTLVSGQEIAYGETVLISYVMGTVQAGNGASLESFNGIEALNTVLPTEPQFLSAESTVDGLTINVNFDREMADPSGKQDQFSVDVQGTGIDLRSQRAIIPITAAALNGSDSSIIELSLNTAILNGQIITLDYTAGDVQSAEGAALESFTNQSVINNVPAVIPVCTSATLTSDGRHVHLGFSRAMHALTAEEANQFGVLVNGFVNEIQSATLSADQRIITLELEKLIGKDNAVHVSYTKGTVSSTNGGLLESFQNKQVNTEAVTLIWVRKDVNWHYSTIQAAIDADTTLDGDIIMVATGTYRENIQLNGKAVVLKSTWETDETATALTVIDGGNNDQSAITIGSVNPVVSGRGEMTLKPVIEGFTIRNGSWDAFGATDRNGLIPIGGIYVGEEAEIRYNIITGNGSETAGTQGCGIYVNGVSAHIHHNIIEENYNQNVGAGIYLGSGILSSERIAEPVSPKVYANTIRNNTAVMGAGVYIAENTTPVNADDSPWERFNVPDASVTFVEHNTDSANNNSYTGNVITGSLITSRAAPDEGRDMYFDGVYPSALSGFELNPATDIGLPSEQTLFNLICTLSESTSEGSLTVDFPAQITITSAASITSDGNKRAVSAGEIYNSGHTLMLQGITTEGTNTIQIDFRLNAELKMGAYGFSSAVDFDGDGARYSLSPIYEATLTIPPLYASPSVAVVSPADGIEAATTTVTFTWEATPGTQTNLASAREVYGIEKYVFYLAENGQDYGSGEDTGTMTVYTKTDLSFGRAYKWKVKAIGNNGKMAYTTPDATFITRYTLEETGDEGITGSDTFSIDTEAWNEYVVTINMDNLPERFTGETDLMLTVDGIPYFFAESQFDSTIYFIRVPYTLSMAREGESRVPSEEDLRKSFFEVTPFVKMAQGAEESYYPNIRAAADALNGTEAATITLYRNLYREGEVSDIRGLSEDLWIRSAPGVIAEIDGEYTTGLFRFDASASVIFDDLILKAGMPRPGVPSMPSIRTLS